MKYSTLSKTIPQQSKNTNQFQKHCLECQEIINSFKNIISTVKKYLIVSKTTSQQSRNNQQSQRHCLNSQEIIDSFKNDVSTAVAPEVVLILAMILIKTKT